MDIHSYFKRPGSRNFVFINRFFTPKCPPKHIKKYHMKNPGKMTLKKVVSSHPIWMALVDLKIFFFSKFFFTNL